MLKSAEALAIAKLRVPPSSNARIENRQKQMENNNNNNNNELSKRARNIWPNKLQTAAKNNFHQNFSWQEATAVAYLAPEAVEKNDRYVI